jgi:hypothetical protein
LDAVTQFQTTAKLGPFLERSLQWAGHNAFEGGVIQGQDQFPALFSLCCRREGMADEPSMICE